MLLNWVKNNDNQADTLVPGLWREDGGDLIWIESADFDPDFYNSYLFRFLPSTPLLQSSDALCTSLSAKVQSFSNFLDDPTMSFVGYQEYDNEVQVEADVSQDAAEPLYMDVLGYFGQNEFQDFNDLYTDFDFLPLSNSPIIKLTRQLEDVGEVAADASLAGNQDIVYLPDDDIYT